MGRMARYVRASCDDCGHAWAGWYESKRSHVKCPKCTGANNFQPVSDPSEPKENWSLNIGGSAKSKGVDLAWNEMQKMGYTDMKDNLREGDTAIPNNPVSKTMQQMGGFYQNGATYLKQAEAATATRSSVGAIDPLSSIKTQSDPLKTGARLVR